MSTEMWTAFEQYQPYADAAGYGESWRRMTQDRTPELLRNAAADAAKAAKAAVSADAADAAWAAWAAAACSEWSAHAAWAAPEAARYETLAIERITRAIKEAQA